MSLARLQLRLNTLEALRPTSAITSNGPWPTAARNLVFDTRIDPLADLGPGENHPVICVYTDEDEGKAGQARGGPPFFNTVDLCFEISVVVLVQDEADPNVYVVGEPETDGELEGSVDILEAQIKFVLLESTSPMSIKWQKFTGRRVHSPHSAPHRTSEEGIRIAKRTIKWKVEIHDDCYDPAPLTQPIGNEILPAPLESFAALLAPNSYGAKIIAGLTREPTAPVMPLAVPLETVGLNVAAHPRHTPPPATPNIVGEVDNLNE
jgi:hypothetical protein